MASTDTPRRTAVAFAIGTFISFSPFVGLQIAAGLGLAFALRLSRTAVLIGLCTNLPWIMVPWYSLTTLAGAQLLGLALPVNVGARFSQLMKLRFYTAEFWLLAGDLMAPFAWAFVVGTTAAATIIGVLAYVLALRFMTRIRRLEPV